MLQTVKIFSYTVNGIKKEFKTIKELRQSVSKLRESGINVDAHSIKIERVQVKKPVSRLQFDSYTHVDDLTGTVSRTLTAYVTVAGYDAEAVFNQIAEVMESEIGCEFARCPERSENDYYCDGMTFEFEYGYMSDLKQDVMDAYKKGKAVAGIR